MTWLIGSRIKTLDRNQSFAPLEKVKKIKLISLTGLTLLELLVVVVIVGGLLAFTMPRARTTFDNLRFDNFCQNLVSRMMYLEERASVEQKSYLIDFKLDNAIITIGTEEEESQNYTAVKGKLGRKIVIPQGVKIEIIEPKILFSPDGTIDGENIVISSSQNKATIYIKESIGRIELKREH
ncbi:hypothetical protein ACFL2Y_03520 [Candidatus Omnitrophota bacterium]